MNHFGRHPKKSEFMRFFRAIGTVMLTFGAAACGQPTPIVLTPPVALLTCKPAPGVPAELPPQGTIERERATVELWLAELEAGADCRSNLAGVKAWTETVGKH